MPPKAAKNAGAKAEVTEVDESTIKQGPRMPWIEVQSNNAAAGRSNHYATFWDGKLLMVGGWSGKVQNIESSAPSLSSTTSGGGAGASNMSPPPPSSAVVGSNGVNSAGHVMEVSQFDFSTNSWSSVPTEGKPHLGTSQAAVVDHGGILIFFGGWNGTNRVNDVTQFNLETNTWSPFAPPATPGGSEKPPGLTFHTASLANKRCYLFGGNALDGLAAEMHYLDLTTRHWAHAASLGAPARRSSHTASVVNDTTIVIVGGRGGTDGTQALNDVALFDTTNNHWMIGVKVEGAPPPRYGHSAIALKNKVIIYGGIGDQGQLLSDCWVLEMEKPTQLSWSRVVQEGKGPSPRTGHVALEAMGSMYIIGGRTEAIPSPVTGCKTSSEVFAMDLGAVAPAPSTAGTVITEAETDVTSQTS